MKTQVPWWRKRAKDLRSRRAQIEQDLLNGNPAGAVAYQHALEGAVDKLGEARVASGLGTVSSAGAKASLALTGLPPFLTAAAAAVVDDEVKRLLKPSTSWLLRLTRPRLWFLVRADRAAQRLGHPQFKLRDLFELPFGDKEGALDFLSRVNMVEWAV